MMRTALTRAAVAAFWMATALYALLSASPFASQQFLQPRLVPAIAAFAIWHVPLSLGVLVVVMIGLLPYLRSGDRVVWAFSGMWLGTALLEVISGGLVSLQPSSTAVAVAIGALIPPVWLALARPERARIRTSRAGSRIGPARWRTSWPVPRLRFVVTLAQAVLTLKGGPSAAQWSAGVARSAILHLAIFSAMLRGDLDRARARPAVAASGCGRDVAGADRRRGRRGGLRRAHHPGGARVDRTGRDRARGRVRRRLRADHRPQRDPGSTRHRSGARRGHPELGGALVPADDRLDAVDPRPGRGRRGGGVGVGLELHGRQDDRGDQLDCRAAGRCCASCRAGCRARARSAPRRRRRRSPPVS